MVIFQVVITCIMFKEIFTPVEDVYPEDCDDIDMATKS